MSVGISTSKIAWSRFVRLVPIALFLLAPIAASIGGERPVDGVAIAGATCPVDVGRGGDTASTPSDTRGGDGCVVFEHSGQFDTFVHTGANQTWTVPPGITSAIVHVVGAGGGGGRSGTAAFGGGGGYATGRLGVTPGQRFDVIVGGSGRRQCFADVPPLANLAQRHNFSFGGGGSGNGAAPYNCTFASGGGRSAVRIEGDSEDLVTAGGGGGGGYAGAGGGGGGLVGAAGGGVGGAGGTQSAGGGSSSPEIGVSGIKYAGGWAGFSETDDSVASEGGGGGGGYFGGGAGGNNGGGGGGSSFLGALASASTTAANGRDAGIAAPTSSVSPTIPPQAAIGSSITATPATWTEMGESVFRWQYSADGTSFSDIDGATSPSFVPTTPGFLRVVETRSNFLGSASAVSVPATVPDTLLASLVATDGILTPAFDPMRLSYSIKVGYRTRTLRLSPVASQAGATVTVGGKALKSGGESDDVDLAVGDTAVIVRVDFAGAVTETTVVVTRAEATVPAVPAIKSVDPGEGSLTVVFDPPADDGGEPIVLYEYSVDGTSWKIAESSTNTFLISGLTNGVVYDVRMRAVNKIGSGGVSASVAGTPKSATTPANEVVTPVPSPSSVSIMPSTSVGSRPERQRQSRSSSTTVVETAGPPLATTTTSVNVTSSTDGPEPPLPSGASTTLPTSATTPVRPEVSPGLKFELVPEFGVGDLAPGARVRAMASGLRPSSPVRLEFHSEPLLLAEGMADGDGNATLTATLPDGLPSGNHLLSLTGVDPAGESLLSVVALQINERGVISQLTPSGSALSELPNAAHVSRMLATNSAPFDAKSDVSGAVALAGAAVVLMGLATGGSGGARSKEPSPGGDSSEDASESAESRRDEAAEGSLASTDAKVLYFTGEGDGAWGDRSRLWMMPGWVSLAGALRAAVRCVERWSTLAVRILQDGTWCRAVFGVGAMVPWVVGLILGLLAGRSIEGVAVPPAFGFVAGIVVVSFLDSLAGAVAWATFTLYVALNGGIATWFDVRTILGLGVLFVALPLIAASFRPVVRERGDEAGRLVVRGFDYLVVSLFVSFAGSSAYQALNGLSGLAVVDAGHADALRWLCMVVVVVRMLAEDGTAAWFPQRRSEAALIVERGTFAAVPYVNLALLIAVYALTAGPYMGMGPRTWIVMGLMAVVPLVKIRRNRLPNVETLHRWFPRGILRSVVMLFVMAWYGRWLIDVTGADARAAVPLMLIPGIVIGLIDCLGRDGGTWPDSRAKNLAGIVLWAVSFSVVAGWVTP